MRGLLQSRTLSELPYISDISESLLTGGLNGLRVETEAFSPGMIVASGVRGGPQSGVGSLLPSLGCSLAWTLTSAIAPPAALRAGGRLASSSASFSSAGTVVAVLTIREAAKHAWRDVRSGQRSRTA